MPINPNIALGAQPQQQPVNMLGQLGQLYALKAAKQEVEGGEALREAFASGGDLNDPAFVQRLRAANPKMALEIEAKNLAGQKTRTEILKDRIAMSRDALANVNTPESYLAWHEANHKDPMMASFFASNGITAEDSRARIMAELAKPGGLDKLKRESALGATELQKQLMQTERTYGAASISAAPGHRQADLAVQKYRDELANPKLERVEGDTGFYLYDPRKPNSAVPLGMAPVAPAAAPVTTPAAPVNSLITTQAAPTINLNALTGGAPNQAGPTVANAAAADAAARAAAAQPSALRPKGTAPTLTRVEDPANKGQMLEVDARTYRGGTIGDPGVIGVARTEKLTPAQTLKLKTEMGKDFKVAENAIASTNELLESIDAVRSSDLKAISGPIAGRTPSAKEASLTAESRIENLKGKVTALGKASAAMTGAIGSIANQEWKILADQIAVLDLTKGEKAVSEQIDRLENMARGTVNRIRDAYERQYGEHFDLAPQYREVPNITYTPGKYTRTGRATSGVDSSNPWLK